MRICGGGGVAAAHVALVAPEMPPLLMQRLPIAEPHSFSDSSSRMLLILQFMSSVSVSDLAIAAAAPLCNNL